jgi:hypothetical protein
MIWRTHLLSNDATQEGGDGRDGSRRAASQLQQDRLVQLGLAGSSELAQTKINDTNA